jgi:hypothetical protein
LEFIEELKCRNIIRVAGLCGVSGWLMAQAASLLPSDAEFDALLARMAHLIGEERRSLAMPPIE